MADLITKADIVAVCGLNSLVEDRKMAPWITEAHLQWRKILGAVLYDLQKANPAEARFVDLMADEKGYGKSYLCWKAFSMAYPSLSVEADRGGVFEKEEAGKFVSASIAKLKMLQTTAESAAETRETLLFAYLRDNETIYPELTASSGSAPRIDAENSKNVGGLSFRRAYSQEQYRG